MATITYAMMDDYYDATDENVKQHITNDIIVAMLSHDYNALRVSTRRYIDCIISQYLAKAFEDKQYDVDELNAYLSDQDYVKNCSDEELVKWNLEQRHQVHIDRETMDRVSR